MQKLKSIVSKRVVDKSMVTIDELKEILMAAHHDCEVVGRASLRVSGMDLPRPVWITLTPNGKYVTFSTYDQPPPYENTADLLSTVNALNRTIDLVRFYIADGYLHGEYMLTYVGGLNAEQCVVAMRIFSRMFEIAFTHSSELRALV